MNHFISSEQLTHPQLEDFFISADTMRALDHGSPADRRELATRYLGRQLISLFYEPSTRTRLSFELAATKLGMGVVSTENAREFSSATKGETLEDTIRVLDEYNADLLVMRHHETGAAARAVATNPRMRIINVGDGKGEHPTQALLDTYTIHSDHGRLDNLNIVLGGDLRQGRTARSLAKVLATYPGNRFTFVTAPGFEMGDDIKTFITEHDLAWQETADMHSAVKEADIVYWTRLQRERLEHSEPVQDAAFIIDQTVLDCMNSDATILHPLPRVNEIAAEVDSDSRARYFRQAGNGLYVRMALIDYLLTEHGERL